jgi:hypothetical protein
MIARLSLSLAEPLEANHAETASDKHGAAPREEPQSRPLPMFTRQRWREASFAIIRC